MTFLLSLLVLRWNRFQRQEKMGSSFLIIIQPCLAKQWHGSLLYNYRFSLVQTVKEEKAEVCNVNILNAPRGAGHQ
jgi:hypothetical protein